MMFIYLMAWKSTTPAVYGVNITLKHRNLPKNINLTSLQEAMLILQVKSVKQGLW